MQEHKAEIIKGLKATNKYISSRFFYDEKGDQIFQEIMKMPEYYVPAAEREIIQNQSEKISSVLKKKNAALNIVELGAGDGTKTIHFLRILNEKLDLTYTPLDISPHILNANKNHIQSQLPNLKIEPKAGNYFETLEQVARSEGDKLYLFLGTTIGNYELNEAVQFTKWLQNMMLPNDHLIIAFDLKKEPRKIMKAYDDPQGITKRFNLNLLDRLNRELDANFDKNNFRHFPAYNPVNGETKSYIISDIKQSVTIAGERIHFKSYEPIYTEISLKYSFDKIRDLAQQSSLRIEDFFTNENHRYTWALMKK